VADYLTSHLSGRPNESLAWIWCRKHCNGLVDKIDDILIANVDDSEIASLDTEGDSEQTGIYYFSRKRKSKLGNCKTEF
jgi:hypothetical protein